MILTTFEEFAGEAARNLGVKKGFSIDKTKVINWLDNENPPTDSELNAEVNKVKALSNATQYQRDRQYPTWQEQMDMQYHDSVDGTTTWKDAVAKVKSDNPKE